MVFFVFSMFYPFELSVHAVYVLLGTLTPGGGGLGGDSAYESGGDARRLA